MGKPYFVSVSLGARGLPGAAPSGAPGVLVVVPGCLVPSVASATPDPADMCELRAVGRVNTKVRTPHSLDCQKPW